MTIELELVNQPVIAGARQISMSQRVYDTFMTGPEFTKWLTTAEANHRTLMTEAGFIGGK